FAVSTHTSVTPGRSSMPGFCDVARQADDETTAPSCVAGCDAAKRCAKARNASTAKTAARGAKCSVARLIVVCSVTQSLALVKLKTTMRKSTAVPTIAVSGRKDRKILV